jgi:hypothetical protein
MKFVLEFGRISEKGGKKGLKTNKIRVLLNPKILQLLVTRVTKVFGNSDRRVLAILFELRLIFVKLNFSFHCCKS